MAAARFIVIFSITVTRRRFGSSIPRPSLVCAIVIPGVRIAEASGVALVIFAKVVVRPRVERLIILPGVPNFCSDIGSTVCVWVQVKVPFGPIGAVNAEP